LHHLHTGTLVKQRSCCKFASGNASFNQQCICQ
jgi:hypothetical protein